MSPTDADAVPTTTTTNSSAAANARRRRPRRVVFLHLDWGIGGAEQLMLQLAAASAGSGAAVALRTAHCDPSHCFTALQGGGALRRHLEVRGAWIPPHVCGGRAQALCSTVRLLYLAYRTARGDDDDESGAPVDLIVLDVLPTPLWILRYFTDASLLFYCHFPDQLLLRQEARRRSGNLLFRWYRRFLDALEERSMGLADTVAVNSKFTQETVRHTFPSLNDTPLPVLYPALEVDDSSGSSSASSSPTQKNPYLIVSLNRFERKKNLGLLLEAVAWLQQQQSTKDDAAITSKIQVVIAGGYDPRNVENVEYRGELGRLAEQLQLQQPVVQFRQSVSDAERRQLLATAAAVVYTPALEHFGIVPLEAMYAETAVVCVNSGGPVETVVDGVTGYLCEATPEAFGRAIGAVVRDPARAARMGRAGRRHVLEKFGPDRLGREWKALTEETIRRGRQRVNRYRVVKPRTLLYLTEAAIALLCVVLLTLLLRVVGLLEPSQSILSGVRSVMNREEL